ncbi:hypothetical protein NOJ28_22345 [Neorhizobium galegae]|nr:hypothetical protein [Neorhizobium galegae]MCQ1768280.1 hypothetical protein [Neorhizobium galegae]MCQ1847252.1 hypothetical protein [Neorhizobium galegae]
MASAGLHAGLQDLGASLAAARPDFARRHQERDHRPGLRP